MKKITAFLGCVGVVCLLWGCADDESPSKADNKNAAEATSSSAKAPKSSASGSSGGKSNASDSKDSSKVDTTVIHQQVVLSSGREAYEDPYFSSGVFCWSAECEKEWAGKSSNSTLQSSSSISIDISMSVEAPVMPEINGDQMKDLRDNQTYKLRTINGLRWMDENIRYKPSKGFFCNDGETDVCATYGVFYNYGTAQGACPGGWRLPTQAEVEAASSVVDFEWWTIGGRFEISSEGSARYGQADEQGRLWLTATESSNSVRIENYSDKSFKFETASGSERAYNVRCVEGSN